MTHTLLIGNEWALPYSNTLPYFSRVVMAGRSIGAWLGLGAAKAYCLKRITPILAPTIMLTVLSVLGTVIIWTSSAAL